MVQYATEDSLCVVDELGRGTDALQGTAIASSFMEVLSELKCRCVFVTHFHHLFLFARNDPNISYNKVDVILDEYGDIVFTYKLVQGVTESSFGIQVAKIAGLSPEILHKAEEMSFNYERGMQGVYDETDRVYK